MRDLAFGLNVPASAADEANPVGRAQTAERLGFDFVSTADHPCGTQPTYETWTMLTWIAAATSRIGIASRVLGVPYRPPAMMAKMAETLDRLSDGRLILGLGAGYSDEEFAAFGLTVPSPREKVEGLEEALRIIRGLWSEPGFTFAGRRYHVADADIEPKPARPIPIWLGTFGDRALAVTGRHADGWIPSLGYAPVEWLPSMRDRVLAAAEAAGRSPDDLTCALNVEVHIGDDADARRGLVGGAPDQVAARLQDFVALGFTAFNFMVVGEAASEQAERLATEIIPELRAAG